jgi:hypothetical protein
MSALPSVAVVKPGLFIRLNRSSRAVCMRVHSEFRVWGLG